ncbi:MAG TPA: cytochrome c oxidase assembly protein [Zeimonas sp.]|nr:cytochrome c oxidase assembly protein [Zeimonas sp.]
MSGNKILTVKLIALCAAMFGFGFALVPLYDVFCQITGIGGRTADGPQQVTENVDVNRTVRVEFVGALASGAPWEFRPNVSHMEVHPGQLYETQYFARNLTGSTLIGHATPSVSPGSAAKYFKKVQCFCFTSQEFAPHEGRDMPVLFMVDPDLPAHIDTVTLGYTFFALDQRS